MIKDLSSTKTNDFLLHQKLPVTLYSKMLTFRDTDKSYKLDADLLATITNYKFKADHANLSDKKIIREIAKEMNFDNRNIGRPSTRDRSVIRLLNSPAIMASGILITKFVPSDLTNYVIS